MKDTKRILCAHRGFNTVAPENTLPAFAGAVVLGAPEIEFDLWPTADGKLVVCHDPTVDRTTDAAGEICEMTAAELDRCDAGKKFSPYFEGLRLPYFEQLLSLFGQKVMMNIHIKSLGNPYPASEGMHARGLALAKAYQENIPFDGLLENQDEVVLGEIENRTIVPYDRAVFADIIALIRKYGCEQSVYITGEGDVLETALSMAPEIKRCCLEGHMNYSIVDNALRYRCSRVQFCKLFLTAKMIEKAHKNDILCNLFWCDDPQEARRFFDLGIDVILTNNYLKVSQALQG